VVRDGLLESRRRVTGQAIIGAVLDGSLGWGHVRELREPMHPQTGRPVSVVFIAERHGVSEGQT
jgi:hypothetical protein